MIKQETKDALIEATTVTPQSEINTPQSETKILVAPLLLYAAISIALVIGIVSTAVYLGKPYQQYNYQVAQSRVNSESAMNNSIDTPIYNDTPTTGGDSTFTAIQESLTAEITPAEVQSETENIATSTGQDMHTTNETPPAISEKNRSLAQTSAMVSTTLAEPIDMDIPGHNSKMQTSRGYALILEQNNKILERLKQNQERQIDALRKQLSMQQSMIERSIKQIESMYETRAVSIMRHNENRQALYRRM